MLNRVFFLSFFIGIYIQNCNQYCNMCNRTENKCILCVDNIGIDKIPINGVCKINNKSKEITTCTKYLKKNGNSTYSCINDKPSTLDINCRVFNSANNCLSCQKGFYLNSLNKCLKVSKEVSNCFSYINNNCLECEPGYILISKICILDERPCYIPDLNNQLCNTCEDYSTYLYKNRCLFLENKLTTIGTFFSNSSIFYFTLFFYFLFV